MIHLAMRIIVTVLATLAVMAFGGAMIMLVQNWQNIVWD